MDNTIVIAEIAVPLPLKRTLHYRIPSVLVQDVQVGQRGLVPLGTRNIPGYIIKTEYTTDRPSLKALMDIIDGRPLFPSSMVSWFRWMADYYMHPIGLVIKNALPGGLGYRVQQTLYLSPEGQRALKNQILTPNERRILDALSTGSLRLQELERRLDKPLPPRMLHAMLRSGWVRRGRRLQAKSMRAKMERYVVLLPSSGPMPELSPARQKIWSLLKREKAAVSMRALQAKVPSARKAIQSMAAAGLVSCFDKRIYRDPLGDEIEEDAAPVMTREQQNAVSRIAATIGRGYQTWVLAGVTGSGKTEVYLQLTAKCIRQGLPVIVLVPEIALISQIEARFRARFRDKIAVLHSALTAGERFDQWQHILSGDVQIAVGARSAIFAPFAKPGLIIVDEEHDTSYKQEGAFRYNARDLAVVRARHHGAVAVLGSATPSIQSYHNATAEKFKQVCLRHRIEKRPLPKIDIVDLRQLRNRRGLRRYLSPSLLNAMEEVLRHRKQVLLFLNRRGFASFPVCKDCGLPLCCRHCDIALTYHRQPNVYRCHYCGFRLSADAGCKACGSNRIQHLGLGTERLESLVKARFPDSIVARMDSDTMAPKGALLKLLKRLHKGDIDILIGTQMVTKGHDFPNITLVGVVCADLSLGFPDFRASERTFQLLAQVAGRAGRGSTAGKMILQTYNPDHFSIQCARQQDFRAFYHQEIEYRRSLVYPPFSRMIQLKISSRDREQGLKWIQRLQRRSNTLLKEIDPSRKPKVLGPIEAPLARMAASYRWQMILMDRHSDRLHQFVRRLLFDEPAFMKHRAVSVAVDVDPFFMM